MAMYLEMAASPSRLPLFVFWCFSCTEGVSGEVEGERETERERLCVCGGSRSGRGSRRLDPSQLERKNAPSSRQHQDGLRALGQLRVDLGLDSDAGDLCREQGPQRRGAVGVLDQQGRSGIGRRRRLRCHRFFAFFWFLEALSLSPLFSHSLSLVKLKWAATRERGLSAGREKRESRGEREIRTCLKLYKKK